MNATASKPELNLVAETAEAPQLSIVRDGMVKTIERIISMIDLETDSLRHYRPIDLAAFNHQKSHALLELTRALRAMPRDSLDREIVAAIVRLREKLESNLQALDVHLKAVRQVSALIARAIEDDDSDGTYTHSINPYVRHL
ncbi:MAG: hypothetical protein ABSC72_10770 [Methylovirgula sp.]|jgi:hypothetical protein